MATMGEYMTKDYKALLHNATIVLSIVMLATIVANTFLVFIAPSWSIRLISIAGVLFCMVACWLLYTAISHFVNDRDQIVVIKWISSFICLLIGLLPIMLFVYLNLDWQLFDSYGRMAIDIYLSFDNIILPLALMLLVSLIYWTLTIQLYKKSYTTYLCFRKKEEIYGK